MEHQILLVDGPIDCGRSKVAAMVAQQLRAKHFVANPKTQAWEYVQAMQPALDNLGTVVIEYSWYNSKIRASLGMAGTVDPAHCRMLNRLALTRDAHHILTLTDLRTYMASAARLRKTNNIEMMIDLAIIHKAWRDMKSELTLYRVNAPELTLLQSALDWSTSLYDEGPGAGAWRFGNILVVGDRHGPSQQPYHISINAPFVSMSGVGCSEWLAKHLNQAKICEKHLYWANCRDQDGEFIDAEFEARLEPTHVVALGRHAQQWCKDNHISCVEIEHPQAHMRFMSSKPYILGDILRKMIDDKTQE